MEQNILDSILRRFEREWRITDPNRAPATPVKKMEEPEPLRRVKIGRVD